MINPRSNSVTGKYSDNVTGQHLQPSRHHGNLLGAGALSNAGSQNFQPSMEGFGGIVGVAAAGGPKGNKQQSAASQIKKKDDKGAGGLTSLQVSNPSQGATIPGTATTNTAKGSGPKHIVSTPSNQDGAAGGILSIAGIGVNGAAIGQNNAADQAKAKRR